MNSTGGYIARVPEESCQLAVVYLDAKNRLEMGEWAHCVVAAQELMILTCPLRHGLAIGKTKPEERLQRKSYSANGLASYTVMFSFRVSCACASGESLQPSAIPRERYWVLHRTQRTCKPRSACNGQRCCYYWYKCNGVQDSLHLL